jgi:hypothetical protein
MEKSALADLATEGSGNDVNDQNHHASATSAHAFACFIGYLDLSVFQDFCGF